MGTTGKRSTSGAGCASEALWGGGGGANLSPAKARAMSRGGMSRGGHTCSVYLKDGTWATQ